MKYLKYLLIALILICCYVSLYCQEGINTSLDENNPGFFNTQSSDILSVSQTDNGSRNQLGASNFVNTFTGDVSFPITLVSLSGKNGLDVIVSAKYNSNNASIEYKQSNHFRSTGVLGFGWTMVYETIVVNNNNTTSTSDDTYYFADSNGSHELSCISVDYTLNTKSFALINYRPWKITYYQDSEKWLIVDDNGTTKTFGGLEQTNLDDEPLNAIQWGVRWGNSIWTPSCGLVNTQADSNRQKQYPTTWNLSTVENTWGEKIYYKYISDEANVGRIGTTMGALPQNDPSLDHVLRYTRSSYLANITDTYGKQVVFEYISRTGQELTDQDLYGENSENPNWGDPYQERVITKVLDNITTYSEGINISRVEFNYDVSGLPWGGTAKRKLTGISFYNEHNVVGDRYSFQYSNDASGNQGAMTNMILPSGASIGFSYLDNTSNLFSSGSIINSPIFQGLDLSCDGLTETQAREIGLMPPDSTFITTPYMYFGSDYIVVCWYKFTGSVQIYAFLWDGVWIPSGLLQIYDQTNHNVYTGSTGYLDSEINEIVQDKFDLNLVITMQDDFFATINSGVDNPSVVIYRKDKNSLYDGSSWIVTKPYIGATQPYHNIDRLISGKDFIIAHNSNQYTSLDTAVSRFFFWEWDDLAQGWIINTTLSSDTSNPNQIHQSLNWTKMVANNNWFAYKNIFSPGNADRTFRLYSKSQDKKWRLLSGGGGQYPHLYMPWDINEPADISHAFLNYAGNDYIVGRQSYVNSSTQEYKIYSWTDDFDDPQILEAGVTTGSNNTKSTLDNLTQYYNFKDDDDDINKVLFSRYNGKQWVTQSYSNPGIRRYRLASARDVVVYSDNFDLDSSGAPYGAWGQWFDNFSNVWRPFTNYEGFGGQVAYNNFINNPNLSWLPFKPVVSKNVIGYYISQDDLPSPAFSSIYQLAIRKKPIPSRDGMSVQEICPWDWLPVEGSGSGIRHISDLAVGDNYYIFNEHLQNSSNNQWEKYPKICVMNPDASWPFDPHTITGINGSSYRVNEDFVSSDCFVLHDPYNGRLWLHKVLASRYKGVIADFAVSEISINTGTGITKTKYEFSIGKYDKSCESVQYQIATITPLNSNNQEDNGKIVKRYFNGVPSEFPPINPDVIRDYRFFDLLSGKCYDETVFKQDGALQLVTTNDWKISTRNLKKQMGYECILTNQIVESQGIIRDISFIYDDYNANDLYVQDSTGNAPNLLIALSPLNAGETLVSDNYYVYVSNVRVNADSSKLMRVLLVRRIRYHGANSLHLLNNYKWCALDISFSEQDASQYFVVNPNPPGDEISGASYFPYENLNSLGISTDRGYLYFDVRNNGVFLRLEEDTIDPKVRTLRETIEQYCIQDDPVVSRAAYSYGWEIYTDLRDKNIITPVVQTAKWANNTPLSQNIVTWKDWGNGKWDMYKTFSWNGTGTGNFTSNWWNSQSEPTYTDGWRKEREIIARDAYGNILEEVGKDGIHTTNQFNYWHPIENSNLVNYAIQGQIVNSTHNEAYLCGFEGDNTEWGYLTAATNQRITSQESFTGNKSCQIDAFAHWNPNDQNNESGSSYMAYHNLFSPNIDQNGVYLLSAWVKAYEIPSYSDGDYVGVRLKAKVGNTWHYSSIDKLTAQNLGKWTKLACTLDLSEIEGNVVELQAMLVNYTADYSVNNTDPYPAAPAYQAYFDEIRFLPMDSVCKTFVTDPVYLQNTSVCDDNGNLTRMTYDKFRRPELEYRDDDQVSTEIKGFSYFQSNSTTQNGSYNAGKPNQQTQFYSRTGLVDNFDYNETEFVLSWGNSSGSWSNNDGVLSIPQSSGVKYIAKPLPQDGIIGYQWNILEFSGNETGFSLYSLATNPSSSAYGYKLKVTSNSVSLIYSNPQGGQVLTTQSISPETIIGQWSVLYDKKTLSAYHNGLRILSFNLPINQQLSSGEYCSFYTNNARVVIDNFVVYKSPTITASFTDGINRIIQTQKHENNALQVSAQFYDDIGRPVVQTKSVKFEHELISYRSGFAAYSPATGLTGDIIAEFPLDNNYPYTRTKYEQAPTTRKKEIGLPGQQFAIQGDSPHTASIQYGFNPSAYLTSIGVSGFQYYTFPHFTGTLETDPQGISTFRVYDVLGREVMVVTDAVAEGQKLTTENIYNEKGLVTHKRLPNYYSPPLNSSPSNWVVSFTYDHYGNLLSKTSPDYGTVEYRYDIADRLVSKKDAVSAQSNKIVYYQYDILSRLVETGTIQGMLRDGQMVYEDNQKTWLQRNSYDGLGTQCGLRNALYATQTRNSTNLATVIERYKYDRYGNTTEKAVSSSSFDPNTCFATKYTYDPAGNVTRIEYPQCDYPNQLIITNYLPHDYFALTSISNGTEDNPAEITIQPGQDITFKAQESITLLPGFTVKEGAIFKSEIGLVSTRPIEYVTYSYDNDKRIKTIGTVNSPNRYAEYTYGDNDELIQERINNRNNAYFDINYSYNSPLWPLSIVSDLYLEELDYTGNYNGNVSSIFHTVFDYPQNSYLYNFQWDDVGRLICANSLAGTDHNYTAIEYDANGNIVSSDRTTNSQYRLYSYSYLPGTNKVDHVSYTYGSNRQSTTQITNHNNYVYDANGSVLSSAKINKSLLMDYDIRSNLVSSIAVNNQYIIDYDYDASGERVYSGMGNSSKIYINSITSNPLTIIDSNDNVTHYIYGPKGIVAKRNESLTYFLLKDHLGSTRVVMNENNQAISSYDYDAWGNPMNSTVSEESAYRYTGREYDDETGLHNFRARLYDSTLMRFYQVDPAEQFASSYVYCGNNPIMQTDPSGMLVTLKGNTSQLFNEADELTDFPIDMTDTGMLSIAKFIGPLTDGFSERPEIEIMGPLVESQQVLYDSIKDPNRLLEIYNSNHFQIPTNDGTIALPWLGCYDGSRFTGFPYIYTAKQYLNVDFFKIAENVPGWGKSTTNVAHEWIEGWSGFINTPGRDYNSSYQPNHNQAIRILNQSNVSYDLNKAKYTTNKDGSYNIYPFWGVTSLPTATRNMNFRVIK